MSTTKAYSYLRFSTTRQVRGDSARRQLELARDYAKRKGLELQELALADMGVSAFKGANRDAALGVFLRLVQDGKIPKGAYLLVESHDRLSRQNVEDALMQFMEIIRAGIVVVTLTDEVEYRQGQLDMSKLMLSLVYMSRANEESEMKSRRAKAVWEQSRKAAAESKTLIRNAYLPQWLKWEGDRVAIIPERAAIVQRMFALAMQGYGYARIAAILNSEGHTGFRKNNPWRPSGVGSLLRNRRVIGEYQNCTKVDGQRQPIGEPIPEYYPAIVSISDFQEVQLQIATRNKHSGSARRGRFDNLFSGILRCQCGASMVYNDKGKKGAPRYYLVCPMREANNCDMPMLRYDAFEPQALVAISHLKPVMDARSAKSTQLWQLQNDIAKLTDQVNAQKARKRRALTLALESDDPMYNESLSNIHNDLCLMESQLDELTVLQKQLLTANRSIQLLKATEMLTMESRQLFNTQLHQSLNTMQLVLYRDFVAVAYYSKELDERPLLEQAFTVGLASSKVMEADGEMVCRTIKSPPYIDTSWFLELEMKPSESYEAIDDPEGFCVQELYDS